MKRNKQSTPFIIWTLQRTGGTNLAKQLIEKSVLIESAKRAELSNPALSRWLGKIDDQWKLHEPFNMGSEGRVFGQVTENWMETQDKKAMEKSIDEICSLHLPMKHCVEMVPWEVSAALAKISSQRGYRHIFLRRENALNRLLSLQFAKLSGVWGPHFVGGMELKEKIFSDPLPVEDLVLHELKCNERLTQAWRLLQTLDADPMAIKFEEIYEAANPTLKKSAVFSILHYLDLDGDNESDDKFASSVIEDGEQGTRNEYTRFKGLAELDAGLKQLKKPTFVSRVYPLGIKALCNGQKQVVHASLDLVPQSVQPRFGFDVGGVLVLKAPMPEPAAIFMLTDGQERRVQWGIPSPAVSKQFPQAANSSGARFKVSGAKGRAGENVDLILRYGNGNVMPLFRLAIGKAAVQSIDRTK